MCVCDSFCTTFTLSFLWWNKRVPGLFQNDVTCQFLGIGVPYLNVISVCRIPKLFYFLIFHNGCFSCSGLMLQLNINQTLYPAFTESAGVRLAVTAHHELPQPDLYGHGIPPGKVAFIGIKKVITYGSGFYGGQTEIISMIIFLYNFPGLFIYFHFFKRKRLKGSTSILINEWFYICGHQMRSRHQLLHFFHFFLYLW